MMCLYSLLTLLLAIWIRTLPPSLIQAVHVTGKGFLSQFFIHQIVLFTDPLTQFFTRVRPAKRGHESLLLQWVSLVIQQPSMSWAGPWPFGLLTARGFSVNSWQNHRHSRCKGKISPRLQKSWSSLSVRRG